MSQTDSFVDEVTDELRQDRLYALAKRYGWIAVIGVMVLVGGTAYREWQKAQEQNAAEVFGDAVLSALETSEAQKVVSGLGALEKTQAAQSGVVTLLTASALQGDGLGQDAREALEASKALNTSSEAMYGAIAALKSLLSRMAEPMDSETKNAVRLELEALSARGDMIGVLAQEQIAVLLIRDGDIDQARELLATLEIRAELSAAASQRISQLRSIIGEED